MFRAVVFTFMPTAIELILVCTLLAQRFRPAVAIAVLVTFVAYVSWTTVMTKVCVLYCCQHLLCIGSMGACSHPAEQLCGTC